MGPDKVFKAMSQDDPTHADFIVLGGGVAGCVIARRLAENGFAVVLVEAGVDPLTPGDDNEGLREKCLDPLRAAELWGSGGWMASTLSGSSPSNIHAVDYAFQTEAERGLDGRSVPLNAGRCMGGGSAINNGLYGAEWAAPRTNPWAEWSSNFGLDEWHPDLMARYVDRVRTTVAPRMPFCHERMHAFDRACSGIVEGVGQTGAAFHVAWLVDEGGRRVTAASAYLGSTPGLQAAAWLTGTGGSLRVLTSTRAIKLLFVGSGTDSMEHRCSGADVEQQLHGAKKRFALLARFEVIVSCGAVLTPVVLMKSGIGPAESLIEAGVQVVIDSPHVGHNLITQPSLPLKSGASPEVLAAIPAVGPPVQPVATAKVPLGRGMELALFQWTGNGVLYAICLCTPEARGDVRLPVSRQGMDPDAYAPPRIRLGLLTHPSDVERFVWSIGRAQIVSTHGELRSLFGGLCPEFPPSLLGSSKSVSWLRPRVSTTRHPLGTCRMGHSLADAVCDGRGRVFCSRSGLSGLVRGLRVADGSLVPSPPPDTHVMRVVLAIGERVADFVLDEYSSTSRGHAHVASAL